jgi:type I restriction enzyme S subunit
MGKFLILIEEDAKRLSRYGLKEGDIVFSRVGRVGTAALAEKKHNGWVISGQTLRIRFQNPELNVHFINYFIQSHIFYRILEPEVLGTTRDSINTTILEDIPIPVPPKIEQDKIVKILSNADSVTRIYYYYKKRLINLKNGLMQKLLTGQIRVKV